jgi:hypothetical protein
MFVCSEDLDMSQRSKSAIRGLRYLSLLLLTLLLLGGALALSLRLSEYPSQRAASLRRQMTAAQLQPMDRISLEKDIIAYETDNRIKIWAAIVQATGGLVLLLGLLFTWRNLRATQDKLDIDRVGQLTTRFTQAAGQLGAESDEGRPNIEVRLGGIYALARIANDSPKDYSSIMEVLTAYVRHNAPWPAASTAKPRSETDTADPKPRTDVQAILTILGRPAPPERRLDQRRLDLRKTDLRGAEFWDAHLENTDFWGANLEGAQLWGARLNGTKLERANLNGANMKDTNLSGAILTSASMKGTDMERADLSHAEGLTKEQVDSARSQGADASLPPGLMS